MSTVMKALTVEERAGKADEMARLAVLIARIQDEAKASAKRYRKEIEEHLADLQAIAHVVQAGVEESSQMELFSQGEAQRALHDVAAAACTCEGGAESDMKSVDCPVHGVNAPEATLDEELAATGAVESEPEGNPVDAGELADELRQADGVDGAAIRESVELDGQRHWVLESDAHGPLVVDKAPIGEAVDVGTVEEPPTVREFRRRKRA